MTRPLLSHRAIRPLLVAMLLSAVVGAGCGDGGGDDRAETAAPEEPAEEAPAPSGPEASSEDALLDEGDLEGWTAHRDVEWRPSTGECGGSTGSSGNALEGVTVEFSRDVPSSGEVRGVFQDVIAFADEEASATYLAAQGSAFADCVAGAGGPTDFVVENVTSLDLSGQTLGDRPLGWRVTFGDPNPFAGVVNGMNFVGIQRGRFVSLVSTFVPIASDVDVLDLASLAYERLDES